MRESGSTRALFRTFACLAVLVPLGLVAAASADAVTITSWVGGKASVPQVVTAGDGNCPATVIMVTGTGFVNDGGPVSVTIGGTPSPQVVVGADIYLWAVVGKGTQSGSVTVTTGKGSATSPTPAIVFPCQSTATASAAPTIDSLSPTKAKAGKKLTLHGSNFVGTTAVTVGGTPAPYAIPSDGIMYVRVPSGLATGSATVEVTNNKGKADSTITVTG